MTICVTVVGRAAKNAKMKKNARFAMMDTIKPLGVNARCVWKVVLNVRTVILVSPVKASIKSRKDNVLL